MTIQGPIVFLQHKLFLEEIVFVSFLKGPCIITTQGPFFIRCLLFKFAVLTRCTQLASLPISLQTWYLVPTLNIDGFNWLHCLYPFKLSQRF